jgi:fructose transport system ATP-binding protein
MNEVVGLLTGALRLDEDGTIEEVGVTTGLNR